jgi:hypothetical protein
MQRHPALRLRGHLGSIAQSCRGPAFLSRGPFAWKRRRRQTERRLSRRTRRRCDLPRSGSSDYGRRLRIPCPLRRGLERLDHAPTRSSSGRLHGTLGQALEVRTSSRPPRSGPRAVLGFRKPRTGKRSDRGACATCEPAARIRGVAPVRLHAKDSLARARCRGRSCSSKAAVPSSWGAQSPCSYSSCRFHHR